MVGKSCLATLGSANSFGIRVSALTSKDRSVCSFGSTGSGYCVWPLCIRQISDNQTSDRKPVGLPFRLEELRTFACFPIRKRQVRGTSGDAEDYYKGYM